MTMNHVWAVAGITSVTLLAFWPVLANGFVNWDDPTVIVQNPQLTAGYVVGWAFSTTLIGHYQPFAWLAWSGLARAFGLSPAAFHAASLLGHLLNGVLVYAIAWRLTPPGWPDAPVRRVAAVAVAIAFAVHPVRVEAVAWASAFPYVLSTTAVLVAFLWYLNRRLALAMGAYAVALLVRPSALAFPLVLLTVDMYPLRRRIDRRVLLEKLPFAILALAAAIAESRAREIASVQEIGLGVRLTMAVSAPFVYLGRTLFPLRLQPLDPLPIAPTVDWVRLGLAAAALAAVALLIWRLRRRWPALAVGAIAYVLFLAPVVGLTPSGLQATADRYMYLPGVVVSLLIGIAVARVWPRERVATAASLCAAAGVVAALCALTWQHARWWHDSITLWTRAADLDPRNDVATYNLAIALNEAGREDEAIARYEETLRLVPDQQFAQHNLNLLRAARAEREGDRLAQAGDLDGAIDRYGRALAIDAARLHPRAARGMALLQRGRFADAAADLRTVLEIRQNASAARSATRPGEASPLSGARAGAAPVEKPDPATVNLETDDRAVANALAFALAQDGRQIEAVEVLKRALAKLPGDHEIAHNLARLLATAPDPAVRDGALALRLALAVRDQTGGRDPRVLDTVAAAYAATGQYGLARQTTAAAADVARQLGDHELARTIITNGMGDRR